MLRILPYKRGSKSAKALAKALGVKRLVTAKGIARAARRGMTIVNWGSNVAPYAAINSKAPNGTAKIQALQIMQAAGIEVPEFTTDINVAKAWFEGHKGLKVVCRTLTRASGGRGIVIAKAANEVVRAPLYTKYFRKDEEYRVHVFNGQVIDIVKKRRRSDYAFNSGFNEYVRTHDAGWVFARNNVNPPELVTRNAIGAVSALGLNFGAVDVLYRRDGNAVRVLEVNTAPGITGTTLRKYVEAIRGAYGRT